MQKLDVVERLFPLIVAGEKTSTIRFREHQLHVGPMVYWCEGNSEKTVTVWVNRCTVMPLSKAAEFLGKAEEWPDEVMLEGMREHYSEIQLSDIVQVIEHLNPKESMLYFTETERID
ncbi:MAG: ASCH domain-containing protein [Sedimenticola sp.]